MRANENAQVRGPIAPWRRLALALIAVALVGAACGGDDNTASGDTTTTAPESDGGDAAAVLGPVDEASGEPVRVGFITDGANATTDQSIDLDVAAATVEYLNRHKAGIGGRPIELVTCEAQLDPARGTDCGNQMVEQQVVAVVVGTTGVVQAVWTPLHDAGIPTMFFAGAGDDVLGDTRSTFSLTDPTASTVGVPIAAAKANDEDKVTVIVIDVPPALAAYEGAGAQQFEDAGLDLELVRVPPGTADMTAQLQPVIAGHPGVIHVLGNDAFCIAAFQAMHALAFDGPVTSITQCITDATREAIPGDQTERDIPGRGAVAVSGLIGNLAWMPGSPQPTGRLRPRNRVAILDAARRLVDDKGEAFTTQDLIKEAGVALQTFYRHFEGKDQLLLAVIGDLTAQHCEDLEERAAGLARPDDRLRFYIVETLDSLVASPGSSASRFMTSQHWRLYQSHPEEVVAANQPFADLVRRELEAGQAAGVFAPRDPETDAWLITKLVMAVFHHYSFLPEDGASRTIVDATLEFCLAAVSA